MLLVVLVILLLLQVQELTLQVSFILVVSFLYFHVVIFFCKFCLRSLLFVIGAPMSILTNLTVATVTSNDTHSTSLPALIGTNITATTSNDAHLKSLPTVAVQEVVNAASQSSVTSHKV
jgi:hypothetical protein